MTQLTDHSKDSAGPGKRSGGSPFTALILLFLFLLLPLGFAGVILDWYFQKEAENHDFRITEESRSLLTAISGFSEVPFRMQKRLAMLRDRYIRGMISPEQWPSLLHRLRKCWGVNFDVYLYDHQGDLITPKSVKIRARPVMAKFWKALYHRNNDFVGNQQGAVKALFGDSWTDLSRFRGQIQKFHGLEPEGLFFWDIDPFTQEGGLIFVLWETPTSMQLVQACIANASFSVDLNLFVRSRSGEAMALHGALATEAMDAAARSLTDAGTSLGRFDGRTWVSLSCGDWTYFLGKKENGRGIEQMRLAAKLILPILGFLGFIFWYRWFLRGLDTYLSIRFKLICFFLYSLMIPFIGILALSYEMLSETKRVLTEDVRRSGGDALKRIDDQFLREPEKYRKIFDKYYNSFNNLQAQTSFFRTLNKHLWAEYCSSLDLRDGSGRVLQEASGKISSEEAAREVLDEACIAAIKRFVPEKFRPSVKKKGAEVFIQMVAASSELGIDTLIEFPGAIKRLILPKIDFFIYGNTFIDKRLPAAFMYITLSASHAKEEFVKSSFLSILDRSEQRACYFAVDGSGIQWTPFEGGTSRSLSALAQHIRLSRELQATSLTWKNRSWLAVGIPGKQLPEYVFLALIPEERVTQPLLELRHRIFIGTGVAFLIAFLLGLLLADTFLVPISGLGKGVQALQAKNVRFRLTRFPKDELGDLSIAFNEMMDSFEEFAAGKTVQNQLFPKGMLSQGAYQVCGVSKPATHLGGDYFDYLRIDDQNLLVIIGDVSGHGIPAALIMAMSKAIVTTFACEGAPPNILLERLHTTINSVMHGKRLMTMGLIWVNTVENVISYFHHGHTFPLIQRPSGVSEYLRATGMPLGTSAKARVKAETISLQKGERLILYTDGLVESLSSEDNDDEYIAFQKYVTGQTWLPPNQACAGILENHPFFKTGASQPDDFTVVVLERS
ncbi:MAG: SpoIIE family protein phosphatase [Candidatus Ozemobacteraceae bacterium]